jgi:hypothetical protein
MLFKFKINRHYNIVAFNADKLRCFINPSSHTMALESTQPLTEMTTRDIPGGKGRPARGADNLTAFCEPIV